MEVLGGNNHSWVTVDVYSWDVSDLSWNYFVPQTKGGGKKMFWPSGIFKSYKKHAIFGSVLAFNSITPEPLWGWLRVAHHSCA